MVPAHTDRRKAFKAALALEGTTAKEWCEAHGISRGHLYAVLRGERESGRLADRVEALINESYSRRRRREAATA